jgi:hypothetical protein
MAEGGGAVTSVEGGGALDGETQRPAGRNAGIAERSSVNLCVGHGVSTSPVLFGSRCDTSAANRDPQTSPTWCKFSPLSARGRRTCYRFNGNCGDPDLRFPFAEEGPRSLSNSRIINSLI